MNRFSDPSQQRALLKDIFLTGGNTSFLSFEERLARELTATLPSEFELNVRKASDPILDAWRGAAGWWSSTSPSERQMATVTRAEYQEKGADYIKVSCSRMLHYDLTKHDLGARVGQFPGTLCRLWRLRQLGCALKH